MFYSVIAFVSGLRFNKKMWCIDAPEFVKACLQSLLSIHVTTNESG